MSNKHIIKFRKVHTLYFFSILNILSTFSSQVLFQGLGNSALKRSMLSLIDKSSQYCNSENKYEEDIICALGRRLSMSTISAVESKWAKLILPNLTLMLNVCRCLLLW